MITLLAMTIQNEQEAMKLVSKLVASGVRNNIEDFLASTLMTIR